MIKTKIIATAGPACSDIEIIGKMLDNGVDVFRLNFSHGTLEEHTGLLNLINSAVAEQHKMIAVIGDICGPKIRIGQIVAQGQQLKNGDTICIDRSQNGQDGLHFTTNYAGFIDDVQAGDWIFIDDGRIELKVTGKLKTSLRVP